MRECKQYGQLPRALERHEYRRYRLHRYVRSGSASDPAKNERAVCAAEAEVILHRDVDLHLPCGVGTVVEITFRILVEDVDGRRADLVMNSQHQ